MNGDPANPIMAVLSGSPARVRCTVSRIGVMASGSRPKATFVCARTSWPMMDWKSRTMVG